MDTQTLPQCALCDSALVWDEDEAAWVDSDGNLRCRPWDTDGTRHQASQS